MRDGGDPCPGVDDIARPENQRWLEIRQGDNKRDALSNTDQLYKPYPLKKKLQNIIASGKSDTCNFGFFWQKPS